MVIVIKKVAGVGRAKSISQTPITGITLLY
jgi:hypothetical protein